MGKRKRSDFNHFKYWLEDSEYFDDKSSDEYTNVNHDSEDAQILSTLQDTSDESDNGIIEKDSGDESDENSVETGRVHFADNHFADISLCRHHFADRYTLPTSTLCLQNLFIS